MMKEEKAKSLTPAPAVEEKPVEQPAAATSE
jgi:hypothetical protein